MHKALGQDSRLFAGTISIYAILLHHSQVMRGVNVSAADVACITIIFVLILRNGFKIPVYHFMFFTLLITHLLLVTFLFVGNYAIEAAAIIADLTKLAAALLYFLLGYNIARSGFMRVAIKWYAAAGAVVGLLGAITMIFGLGFTSEVMLYWGTRLRGFMMDPNYFAVVQITSLACLSRLHVSQLVKRIGMAGIALSVILSGSKSGLITLVVYVAWRYVGILFGVIRARTRRPMKYALSALLVGLLPLFFLTASNLMRKLAQAFPIVSRLDGLSLVADGSGRDLVWMTALSVIGSFPLTGVGLGSYRAVALKLFETSSVAHNTYLQTAAEWGLPITVLFFAYVFSILLKASKVSYRRARVLTYRDVVLVLLIGSLGISLNNARMFWFFLGALASDLQPSSEVINDISSLNKNASAW